MNGNLTGMSLTVVAWGLASGAVARAEDVPPPRPDVAFATTGAATVSGGRLYPPFYNYVIGPHAVVAGRKVFCAFQDTQGRPIVMAYEIDRKRWHGPVRGSNFGLKRDSHGNPSLCVDRHGYVHLFYGCHGGPMRHTRSVKPMDISAWKERPPPTRRATYPQSMRMKDDRIFLFYRAGGHMEPWCLRISDDDGRTWSDAQPIIEMRRDPPDRLAAAYCFFLPGRDGCTVHCFWNHKDDNAARVTKDRPHPWRPLKYPGLHEAVYRYNVYYAFRDEKGTWRGPKDQKVSLPISKKLADAECLVYDSGQAFSFIPYRSRLVVDADNRPYYKVRTGVVDWVRHDPDDPTKALVPVRDLFVRIGSDGAEVAKTMLGQWPTDIKKILHARGLEVYGDRSHGRWFIFCTRKPLADGQGSHLFLYRWEAGYAAREGGPADVSARTP